MTYRVTQQDMDGGLRREPRYCPIARSIKRRHPTSNVVVHTFRARVGTKYYKLPHRVTLWICRYDHGEDVRPIRFEL